MRWLVVLALAGCAGNLVVDPYAPARGGVIARGPGGVPDVRCAGPPATGPARGFRRWRDRVVASLGHADHRGFDLVAASTSPQVIAGKLAYGVLDKALAREQVELFACVVGAWEPIGTATTDADGRFARELEGTERLPVGLRDLYASVVADRTGVRFLAYVAPAGTRLVVSDIDGTLTSAESSFTKSVILGGDVAAQPGAAASLQAAREAGYQVVYLTARGDRFTDATRNWLGTHGFPRGPVRIASGLFVKPGAATVAFKQRVLRGLEGFAVVAGVGNRWSDVAAYEAAGVPAAHIFVKLPEYTKELGAALRSGAAVGFGAYGRLTLP
jgi:phosphatidate phosphatase PAH1